MDSSNEITHKKIHRTPNKDFKKRLNNIRKLADGKPDTLTLGISFIITPDNVNDIEQAAKLYASIKGINHIRFSWMYDKQGTAGLTKEQIEHIGELIPRLQTELDRDDFKIFNEKNRIQLYTAQNNFDKCHFQKFVMAIGSNGGIWPCCIMKYYPEFEYANLKNNTLSEIINDMNVKAKMDNLDPINCNPCWLADRNGSIDEGVKNPDYEPINKPVHANFI